MKLMIAAILGIAVATGDMEIRLLQFPAGFGEVEEATVIDQRTCTQVTTGQIFPCELRMAESGILFMVVYEEDGKTVRFIASRVPGSSWAEVWENKREKL